MHESEMAAGNRTPTTVAWLLYAALLGATWAGLPSAASAARAQAVIALAGIHDITKLGAVGDGKSDNTGAMMQAWKAACAGTGTHRIEIPAGDFLTGPMNLQGPCTSSVIVRVTGNLLGTGDLKAYTRDWIQVYQVDNFVIEGRGAIDGQGSAVWESNHCKLSQSCKILPMSLVLGFVRNATIRGITLKDSKFFHINLFNCTNITVKNVKIVAPPDSPNTDGIHMGDSESVMIRNVHISTGDDCISVGPGSRHIKVRGAVCGPGHGISVGSLGRNTNEADVEDVDVRNCTIRGTAYGLRIKSFADSKSELRASNFLYKDVVMDNVSFPIIIDQQYCPSNLCSGNSNSRITVQDVLFDNIVGTSATPEAVTLNCDKNLPCSGVQLVNVDLKYTGTGNTTMAVCKNAIGKEINVVQALASCLSQ